MFTLRTPALLLTLALLGPAAAALPAPLAAPAPLVEDDDLPDKREVVEDLIDELKGHVKKKGDEDDQAIAVIDKLKQEFDQSGPKDRKDIVEAIDDAMMAKRKDIRSGKSSTPDVRLAMSSAIVLGYMGPESTKPLIKAATGKKLMRSEALHREAILSLGKTKDEDAIDPLLELATYKLAYVQGAAIEGLGNFRDVEQDVRKEIFSELMKNIMPIKAALENDANEILARERYDVIAPPTITTLQRLTDKTIRDFNEWQTWWNDHKRDDWDA